MGAGVRDAFPPPMCCVDCLRVSFGWIICGRLMSLEMIVRKWLFCLCGIAWKNITERGRGGAYVPARVAPQGRIHRSSPAHNACILGMETPLRGRSGGHTGTAPTISRVAPCPKVAGRGSADGLKQEKVAGRGSADGLKQEKVAGRGSADGQKRGRLRGRGV